MKAFLKWAGGKRLVYKETSRFFPDNFDRFMEPFLGGGTVLLSLSPEKFIVSDINSSLINTYIQVRDNQQSVISTLNGFKATYSRDFYFKIRDQYNENPLEKSIRKASEFVFLNKTCFNGLYRVNKLGKFNVPFGGRDECPELCDKENLMEVSRFLNGKEKEILNIDFRKTLEKAEAGDFIYMDPPYIHKGSFRSYDASSFSKKDYLDMVELSHLAYKRGASVVISNSINDNDIFGNFETNTIERITSVSGHTRVRIKSPEYVHVLKGKDMY